MIVLNVDLLFILMNIDLVIAPGVDMTLIQTAETLTLDIVTALIVEKK
jgi:hypothetical protein